MSEKPKNPRRRFGLTMGVLGAALGIAVAVWVSNPGTGSAATCPARAQAAEAIDAAATGDLAALNPTPESRDFSQLSFLSPQGEPMTLADLEGKKLLVNFWATWCVPCREEMPALDALAQTYNTEAFEVVTVNLDAGEDGPGKAQAFLDEMGLESLPLYADPSLETFDTLRNEAITVGLPTTILVDENGCGLAILQGPAEWDSPDGHAVVEAMRDLPPPEG